MKKFLIATTMLITLSVTMLPAAQQPTPNQQEEQSANSQVDELEAYSDTTSQDSDTTVVSSIHRIGGYNGGSMVDTMMDKLDANDLAEMLMVLAMLLVLFVLSPLAIIIALFYFINKSRKQKMQLAQMAMQNGQPIPQELLNEARDSTDELWQKGVRQVFLGIGLMCFLGYTAGKVGLGIGLLVALIGVGKLVIVKTSGKNNRVP